MTVAVPFSAIDWVVLAGYFVGIIAIGGFVWRREQSSEEFTSGSRRLPGWLCGLSIFATYLSSISYLALPGKAFSDNWNAAAYSIALPIAAWIAVGCFVPLYRRNGVVSAYALLETRFGLWARCFASGFYLLYQVARIGVVMYLMALPLSILFGWDIRALILLTGIAVTSYAFIGGIVAVIWADAVQAVVLLAGASIALIVLINGLPDGITGIFDAAQKNQKFSLGSASPLVLDQPTVWVVLAFGLFDNLRNFGIDQSYVQRYVASRSDREAAKSVWLGALLYVPVSFLFLFIGTALFAHFNHHQDQERSLRRIVAQQRLQQIESSPGQPTLTSIDEDAMALSPSEIGDRAFPFFIATNLPTGVRGLLIAAIFAAAMSTVSTSLNSAATLILSDFYLRFSKQPQSDKSQLRVLRIGTIIWGCLGTAMALALVPLTESALDIWWLLSGVLGAGIVGLFLAGLAAPRLSSQQAIWLLVFIMLLITWMTISIQDFWPTSWSRFASPFHGYLVIVIGPCVMILGALMLGRMRILGKK